MHCLEVASQCNTETQGDWNKAPWFLHTKVGVIRDSRRGCGRSLEDCDPICTVILDMNTDLVVETFTFDKVVPVV